MNITPYNNNQQASFGAAYRVHFRTSNNEPILSVQNMEKCLHYLEAHLNRSKRITKSKNLTLNQDLIDTFCGKPLPDGTLRYGDADYRKLPIIRRVPTNTEKNPGYMTIVTGEDAVYVDEYYGAPIGRAKRENNRILGNGRTSFELKEARKDYKEIASRDADRWLAMFYDGVNVRKGDDFYTLPSDIERIYIDAVFDPVYYTKGKSKGKLKGFEFKSLGFFRKPEPKEEA